MRIVRRPGGGASLRALGREIPLPRSRPLRLALAAFLIAGSLLAVLPVFGLWMLPLGLLVLAADHPPAERLARWILLRALRLRRRFRRSGTP